MNSPTVSVSRLNANNDDDRIQAKKTGGFLGFGKKFDSWDIDGGVGNDTLIGGEKRDSLRGGTGIDVLEGRQGDDRYFVDGSEDLIIERQGEGDDLVMSKAISFALPDNVENIDIDEPNLVKAFAFGNSLSNDMFGADSTQGDFLSGFGGNDRLFGFNNDDTLLGGTGFDSLDGGQGNDSLQGSDGSTRFSFEEDTLIGGGGEDTFVLGLPGKVLYARSIGGDFAVIQDFEPGRDRLQLAGKRSDYFLSENSNLFDAKLFYDADGSGTQTRNDEPIAVFRGKNSNTVKDILLFDTNLV